MAAVIENRRVLFWLVASFLVFGLFGCGKDNEMENSYTSVTMKEGKQMMEEPGVVLLDVRTPQEFADGHIPGAINIPNEEIEENKLHELSDLNATILVYCRSGRRSKEAAGKMAKAGYTNIIEIGGIIDWDGETEK